MFITMSTIGYGDINVLSTFSRLWLFFISISGLCVTSIMVVSYSSFLELNNTEDKTYSFYIAL